MFVYNCIRRYSNFSSSGPMFFVSITWNVKSQNMYCLFSFVFMYLFVCLFSKYGKKEYDFSTCATFQCHAYEKRW